MKSAQLRKDINLTKEDLEKFKLCSEDIIEFTKHVQIFNPKDGYLVAYDTLFPKQKKILKNFQKNWKDKFSVLLSPRQSGKTTIVLLFILWLITFHSSSNVGILANKKDSARKIFRRFSQMYRKLPDFLKLSKEIGDSKLELELDDGTIVFCAATSRSGLRSDSITFLYLDEFAFLQTPDLQQEFWQANYPILEAMSGGLCVSSTPNGKDLFYDLYLKANDPNDKQWVLEEIKWKDVFNRDDKWRERKILDLSAGGKNGEEVFEQEYNNSFDVKSDSYKFFNQEIVGKLRPQSPIYEWKPDKEFKYRSFTIFEDIQDQHFIIGADIAEGKGLNFSTICGLSLRKKILPESNVYTYKLSHAFHFMDSKILPEDFFNLLFQFLILQLNDQWYLIFEYNNIGAVFASRIIDIFNELTNFIMSTKNQLFKDILHDKFGNEPQNMIEYLKKRIFITNNNKKNEIYGFKVDRQSNILLKNNLKTIIDKNHLTIKDEYLIEEMKEFEEKSKGESMSFDSIDGISHFDNISALKFALWPIYDRDLMKSVFSISPLKKDYICREKQILDAIINGNRLKSKKEINDSDFQNENRRILSYGLTEIENMGDMTSLYKNKLIYFKK